MPAEYLHLVRHGEVHNPDGVLYGRLAGFPLSEKGRAMATAAATALYDDGVPVTALIASPLLRTQQSAEPWTELFGLTPTLDERVIEPWNKFQGERGAFGGNLLIKPQVWPRLINPLKPSWGEPYAQIESRMLAALRDAAASVDRGHVVIVSHQLPIWTVHRSLAGEKLFHDPRRRRCSLSSITTVVPTADGGFREVEYREPAAGLIANAVDEGAV